MRHGTLDRHPRRSSGSARRRFRAAHVPYNYRLYDRYACPIASLAVLADDDDGWKPDHFGFEVLGCRHDLHFPIVKLSELGEDAENLASNPNPFALVTAAYRRTRQTRHDAEARYQAKRHLSSACSIDTAGSDSASSISSPCSTG